jgi:hypothetical protein
MTRFTDSWYKNDTLWRIRELPVSGLLDIMARLPPAEQSATEFAKAEMIDPARGLFLVIFQRKVVNGRAGWFIYQVEFHAH